MLVCKTYYFDYRNYDDILFVSVTVLVIARRRLRPLLPAHAGPKSSAVLEASSAQEVPLQRSDRCTVALVNRVP